MADALQEVPEWLQRAGGGGYGSGGGGSFVSFFSCRFNFCFIYLIFRLAARLIRPLNHPPIGSDLALCCFIVFLCFVFCFHTSIPFKMFFSCLNVFLSRYCNVISDNGDQSTVFCFLSRFKFESSFVFCFEAKRVMFLSL